MNDLTNSREFIEGIVDKIVNETNLSEVIMKIEPIIKENQELRSLICSQQQMMNEMNMLLFRLLNEQQNNNNNASQAVAQPSVVNSDYAANAIVTVESNGDCESVVEVMNEIEIREDGLNDNGLYSSEMTGIVLSEPTNNDPLSMTNDVNCQLDHIDEDDDQFTLSWNH